MTSAEDAIALLRSRVERKRLGRSIMREMDQDVLAMRKAIELLEPRVTWSHDPQCEQARGQLACGCKERGWKTIAHPEPEDAVREAWTVPGIRPDYHDVMKAKLRRDWPVLANALDRLTGGSR